MKKLMLTVAVALLTFGVACADSDRIITVDQLPQKAQQFLLKYYPKVGVSYAKQDRELVGTDYEVVLEDGTKMDFASDGEWTSVECRQSAVPADIVPKQIQDYVAKKYPNVTIHKIDRERNEYEVSLSNRLELTFNKKFQLVDIDD